MQSPPECSNPAGFCMQRVYWICCWGACGVDAVRMDEEWPPYAVLVQQILLDPCRDAVFLHRCGDLIGALFDESVRIAHGDKVVGTARQGNVVAGIAKGNRASGVYAELPA